MSQTVQPGSPIASRFSAGVGNTGLTGTIRFRLIDADPTVDDPVVGPTTSGIVEDPTGSGDYMWNGDAPDDYGKYFPAWDLGSGQLYYDEDIIVTDDMPAVVASGNLYVTKAELRVSLELDEDDGSDDELELACAAASRACDYYKHTRFYPTTGQARIYTTADARRLHVDQFNTLYSVQIDYDCDGTYEVTLTEGSDYIVEPANAASLGQPWNQIILRRTSGRYFPSFEQSVKVTASYGWSETPPQVKRAATLIAAKLFKRRETPYAMVILAGEVMAAARIGQIDPDAQMLLDQVPPVKRPVRSLQLG